MNTACTEMAIATFSTLNMSRSHW